MVAIPRLGGFPRPPPVSWKGDSCFLPLLHSCLGAHSTDAKALPTREACVTSQGPSQSVGGLARQPAPWAPPPNSSLKFKA